jgi:hypothetical protein
MGRKSSIDSLPKPVKDRIGKLLKENRLTLEQVLAELERDFGADTTPSKTALWRHKQKLTDTLAKVRQSREIAQVWVAELGEKPDGDTGRLMVELLQSMVTQYSLEAIGREGDQAPKLAELKALAQTIRASAESGKLTLAQTDLIEKRAREKLLREQQDKLDALGKKGGLDAGTLAHIRSAVYGLS